MPYPHSQPDRPSRAVGLIAFLVGIAMLAAVFVLAYQFFTQPVPGLGLSGSPHSTPPPVANIGASLAGFLEKMLLLTLLTIVGSVVAGRGVHLCFAAHGPHSPREGQATAGTSGHGTASLAVLKSEKEPVERSA